VAPSTASGSQTIRVDVAVKNTGSRAGKEVVHCNLNERVASVTPPFEAAQAIREGVAPAWREPPSFFSN